MWLNRRQLTDIFLEGQRVKAKPAFNIELCEN
jgi:hypothetical protein